MLVFCGASISCRRPIFWCWNGASPCTWSATGIWPRASAPNTEPTKASLAEGLAALIDDAVRYRLGADVDVGAFLSGGIDSTSVVSAMCRSRLGLANHTYSIGFIDQAFDEAPFARRAAAMLGTSHHEEIAESQLLELFDRAVYHADEPFADTSLVPTLLLCEFAARNTKVCLSGEAEMSFLPAT
jgi:asparagine synthase (glutamine-hydrolysing)